MVIQVMARMRVYFRFVEGCSSPRDVSGSMAWTTRTSSFRVNEAGRNSNDEIYLSYRTRDGKLNEAWVQVRNLTACQPRAVDRVLVLSGADVGEIHHGVKFIRNKKKEKTGISVRIGYGKSKTSMSYAVADVTRVADYTDPV